MADSWTVMGCLNGKILASSAIDNIGELTIIELAVKFLLFLSLMESRVTGNI